MAKVLIGNVKGRTPELTAGTVEMLEEGEEPFVEIEGTPDAPVLNFGIPQTSKIIKCWMLDEAGIPYAGDLIALSKLHDYDGGAATTANVYVGDLVISTVDGCVMQVHGFWGGLVAVSFVLFKMEDGEEYADKAQNQIARDMAASMVVRPNPHLVKGYQDDETGELIYSESEGTYVTETFFKINEYFAPDYSDKLVRGDGIVSRTYGLIPYFFDKDKNYLFKGVEDDYFEFFDGIRVHLPKDKNAVYVRYTVESMAPALELPETEKLDANFPVVGRTKYDFPIKWDRDQGGYWDKTTGTPVSDENYYKTELLKLPKRDCLWYHKVILFKELAATENAGVCFFDENKTFISGENTEYTEYLWCLDIPKEAAYVAFSTTKDHTSSSVFVLIDQYEQMQELIKTSLSESRISEESKQELVNDVLNALPTWEGGSF